MVLKKGPLLLYLFMLHQKKTPVFYTCYTKILLAESNLNFSLSENLLLHENPFHIVNCLKFFEFTLFFVYTLKLFKAPLWHIFFCFILKNMTCSRACGSRVVHQLLNKTMQKPSAKSRRGAPQHL